MLSRNRVNSTLLGPAYTNWGCNLNEMLRNAAEIARRSLRHCTNLADLLIYKR